MEVAYIWRRPLFGRGLYMQEASIQRKSLLEEVFIQRISLFGGNCVHVYSVLLMVCISVATSKN